MPVGTNNKNNMKRLAIFLASVVLLGACSESPSSEWDYMPAVDSLTNSVRAKYGQDLLTTDFNWIRIGCVQAGDSPKKHIHIEYKYFSFPIRVLDLPPSECELGPAAKVEAWSGRYSPRQIYAYGRRQYTLAAIQPYIDAMIADNVRDHL